MAHSEGSAATGATKNGHRELGRFWGRLAASARRIAARAARIAGVNAALAAVGWILPEADVFEALRLAATIADVGPTSPCERASLGVDHATQRTGLTAAIGQTTATIDSLTVATTPLLVARTRTLRPGGRAGHGEAGNGQNGRPQLLNTSVPHDFLLL
jgi:hypothetical protein